MTSGLISIIIPTYNSSHLLTKTLDSIISQLYNHTQIIIVDDNSKDAALSQKLALSYNATFIQNQKNMGAPFSRNTGFQIALGEFLFFCDSDIILDKSIFIKMIQAMHTNPLVDWIYCNYFLGKKQLRFQEFDPSQLNKINFCSTMSLIRKTVFPGFTEHLKRLQDWDLFLKLMENGSQGKWLDEYLFYAEDRKGITHTTISWDQAVQELRKLHPNLGKQLPQINLKHSVMNTFPRKP